MPVFRLAHLGAALIVVAIASLGYYLYYNTFFVMNLSRQVRGQVEEVVQSAYYMCQECDRHLQKRGHGLLENIERTISQWGEPYAGAEQSDWKVRRAHDPGQARTIKLPTLKIQNGESDQDISEFVGALVRNTDAEVAILQILNDQGDQVKIYCTLSGITKPEQETYKRLAQPPGAHRDRTLNALQRGEVVVVPEYFQGRLYLSVYRPIREGRTTIGAIVLRVIDADLDRLREELVRIRIGQSGYVYVLKASGAQRGHYILSRFGERDGEDIWDVTDSAGRPIIQAIISQALNLDRRTKRISVPMVHERYPWKNPGENYPRQKTAAITYFEPWDWVIGAGYYENEL